MVAMQRAVNDALIQSLEHLREGKMLRISLRDMKIDPQYQRQRSKTSVRKMVNDFKPWAVGVFYVNLREDNEIYVLDGQHRREVLLHPKIVMEYGITEVDCYAYYGLTPDQEAAVFYYHNKNRKALTPGETMKALMLAPGAEGDKARALADILGQLGFTPVYGTAKNKNEVSALYTCLDIIKRGDTDGYPGGGAQLLREVLFFVQKAFDAGGYVQPLALHGKVLEGIAIFLSSVRNVRIDLPNALKKFSGDLDRIISLGRALGSAHRVTEATGIAHALVQLYNHGKRAGVIDVDVVTRYMADRQRRAAENLTQNRMANNG